MHCRRYLLRDHNHRGYCHGVVTAHYGGFPGRPTAAHTDQSVDGLWQCQMLTNPPSRIQSRGHQLIPYKEIATLNRYYFVWLQPSLWPDVAYTMRQLISHTAVTTPLIASPKPQGL